MSDFDPMSIQPDLLVIDGDHVAFSVASLLEKRSVKVFDEQDNVEVGTYKNKTTFKKSSDFNEEKKEYYRIEDQQELDENWKARAPTIIHTIIKSYLHKTRTDQALVAFGAKENFRDSIPTPTKYKSHRTESLRPLLLQDIKLMVRELYPYEEPPTGEADDVVAFYQWKSLQDDNRRIVVCTIDKDATQTPCKALYNPDKGTTMSIKGLGEIYMQGDPKPKLKSHGRMTLYYQMLHGDPTDCYSPCDVYKQINNIDKASPCLTDLKTYNILKDCKTDKECWEAIVKQYKEWYGEEEVEWTAWDGTKHTGDYLDIMQMNWDYCYMLRFPEDKVEVRDVLKKLGVID